MHASEQGPHAAPATFAASGEGDQISFFPKHAGP
jgi:hypothetical protein